MDSLSLRKYRLEDWEELSKMFMLNVPLYFAEDEINYLKKHLENYGETYCVACLNKGIVGAGGYYFKKNGEARLSWFFTHPEYQNQGVGKSLVINAISHIKKSGIIDIEVWTSQYASDFFSKFGFNPTKTVEDYWAPGIHLHKMKKKQQ
jgi:ribosomal protein S18 acetylase RimI-like enzyme